MIQINKILLLLLVVLFIAGGRYAFVQYQNRDVNFNNKGVVLQDSGDIDGALAEYKKALEIKPENSLYNKHAGMIYLDKGDLETAKQHFSTALKDKFLPLKDRSDIYAYYADTLLGLGNYPGALENINKSLQFNAKNSYAYYVKAGVLTTKKIYNYAGALDMIDKYIAAEPVDYRGYNKKGDIQYDEKKIDSAIANYKKSIQLNSQKGRYLHLGHSYLSLGKNRDALQSYKQGLAIDSKNYLYRFYTGYTYYQLGDYQKAYSHIQQSYNELKASGDNDDVIPFYYLLVTNQYKTKGETYVLLKKLYNLSGKRLTEVLALKSVLDEFGPAGFVESLQKIEK